MHTIRALVAEDEPILAIALIHTLNRLWPELVILPVAENGAQAVQAALEQQPDILFLDIRMPAKTGLEVAQELAEDWPEQQPFPLIVFVTAYDEFALKAFELAAVDYLQKPINDARMLTAIERLQKRLLERRPDSQLNLQAAPANSGNSLGEPMNLPAGLDPALLQLLNSLQVLLPGTAPPKAAETLRFVRAAVGNQVKIIPVQDVVYFEATDKYVNVVHTEGEALIRTSLRDLLAQLDSDKFWQIHRGTIVNSAFIIAAQRDDLGKMSLKLKGRNELLRVSSVYAHLFKQM